jgi:hypothetical protein
MKTRHGHVIQVIVGFNDVASDQRAQFVQRDPQHIRGLLLGVLRLGWFYGERSLIHECLSCILRGKQAFTQSGKTLGFQSFVP